MRLTLADRAAAYNRAYAKWPASHLHIVQEQGHDVIYGKWRIGARYGNETPFPGAYPRTYLPRMLTLFPTPAPTLRQRRVERVRLLHAFSGSLPAGPYHRLDINPTSGAEYVGDVCSARKLCLHQRYEVVFADPPYTPIDAAEKYQTKMIDRLRVTNALAEVVVPGGFLVWLDTTWPMHSKQQWVTVGSITVIRATNHRIREATIFERAA